MGPSPKLKAAYERLLKEHGLQLHPHNQMIRFLINNTIDKWSPKRDEGWREYYPTTFALGVPLTDLSPALSILLEKQAQKIEQTITQRLGHPLSIDIFVGEFPIGVFNAAVFPLTEMGGALILVNTGLFMLFDQFLRVLRLMTGFIDKDTIRGLSGCTEEQMINRLAAVVLWYHAWREPHVTERALERFLPRWPQGFDYLKDNWGEETLMDLNFRGILLYYCQQFVLAHEYGHVIAGHVNSAQTITVQAPQGYLEVMGSSPDMEFLADMIAIHIMYASLNRDYFRVSKNVL